MLDGLASPAPTLADVRLGESKIAEIIRDLQAGADLRIADRLFLWWYASTAYEADGIMELLDSVLNRGIAAPSGDVMKQDLSQVIRLPQSLSVLARFDGVGGRPVTDLLTPVRVWLTKNESRLRERGLSA